jgi:hypothetical protein
LGGGHDSSVMKRESESRLSSCLKRGSSAAVEVGLHTVFLNKVISYLHS